MISFQHVGSIFSFGGALPSSQVPLQSVMCSSAVRASFPLTPVFDVHVNSTMLRFRYASWRRGSRRRRSSLVACCALRPAVRAQEFAAFTEENFEAFLLNAQSSICEEAAAADGSGKVFVFDKWQRGEDAANGYGITRVMEGGDLLEKAAVNVSIVRGHLSESRAKVDGGHGWFGGGADLTPCYLFEDDVQEFHTFYKEVCDKYESGFYDKCKMACDAYFYIPARKEHRGTGGIFFDDLETFSDYVSNHTKEVGGLCKPQRDDVFSFVRELAEGFMPSYLPIAKRRHVLDYGERERQWQLLRRGRYLEFNLLYDRGVKFGLDGGRIESIMVSGASNLDLKYGLVQ
ncbi:hypothetical protein CY35_15G070900 [Sphagnum magellanicum]|nr:hypothetical protein CY35_15G070900 [Sphagnum magellanicum]